MFNGSILGSALALTLVVHAAQAAPPAHFAREQFMTRCLPVMKQRAQKFPDHVCGCLHDKALAVVHDDDMRTAVMRNIEDTGRPGVDRESVPVNKRGEIDATLTAIASPAMECLYGRAER